jgi:hypothetical protein
MWFDPKTHKFNWPKHARSRASRRLVHIIPTLEQLVPEKPLRDLVYKLLDFSPNRRITAEAAIALFP